LFYDLADENGILVWQDFLFGCTTYPHDQAFLQRVQDETTFNIKRLRNHACLALWCGNNEILEGMHNWGWEKRYSPAIYKEMFTGYDLLFRKLLPQQVAKFDNGRSYIHGSPLSSNWGKPESWPNGDSHNWGVWYGKKNFESFNTETGRFMSEFGFQSFPEMKTIASFADSTQWSLESDVMNAHQKSSIGNSLIRTYMERDFRVPEKFEDFVYTGLVLQGKGMRYGLEAQRRNKPYCMGSLYWQLNDSWPVVSWSGIDYFGNWKALHYDVARAFAPVLISPYMQGDTLMVYLVSDLLQHIPQVKLKITWKDVSGKTIRNEVIQADLAANVSMKIIEKKLSLLFSEEKLKDIYADLQLYDKQGELLNRQIFFPSKTKDLLLPDVKISQKTQVKKGQIEIKLKTDKLAKDVFIEIPVQGARFSDNFFDLLPGETKTIRINSPLIEAGKIYPININHIKKTYN
jgi:beta-mannosidase